MENSGKVLIEREKFLHQGGAGFPLFFHRKEQGLVGNVGDFSTSTEIVWKMRKTSRFPKRSFRPPFPKGGGVQRQRLWPGPGREPWAGLGGSPTYCRSLCNVACHFHVPFLPHSAGSPLSAFFALHKVSHALRAIKIRHWHVRFLSETNIRKKADGKKRRGRDWEAYRAGNLSPDLPGASVHHP